MDSKIKILYNNLGKQIEVEMKKIAFTLAETLVVLVVIGFLAIILLNSLEGLQPDREKAMFKKAYQITERTVGELVNDESIYPYDPERFGFFNTSKAYVEGTNTSFEGDEKFCQFFARKLNTYSPAVWDSANGVCVFQTTDSVSWSVPSIFTPSATDEPSHVVITVDINGSAEHNGKGPNTRDDDPARDIYDIIVEFDGRVRVAPGGREEEFLKSHEAHKNKNSYTKKKVEDEEEVEEE